MTHEQAITAFCRALNAAGRSASTQRSYMYLLQQWGRWLEQQDSSWCTVSDDLVEDFIEEYAQGHSRTSTALMITCLRSFYRWCVRRRHISRSPLENVPSSARDRPLPRAIPSWQIHELLRRLNDPPDELTFDDLVEWRRNRRIVLLYLYTGIRLAELAALDWDDLDIEAATLRVWGKGGRERVVPVHPTMCDELRPLAGQGPIFISRRGGRLTASGISEMFRRFVRDTLGFSMTAHQLRHTFATELRRRGVDIRSIQQLMGHAKLDTTAIYTLVYPDDLVGAVSTLAWVDK